MMLAFLALGGLVWVLRKKAEKDAAQLPPVTSTYV
jgi:hypothetical protein